MKCIVCYGVGAEPADPGGDSSRLRLSKVKRGLGGRRDIASRALVPRLDLCPSKLPCTSYIQRGARRSPPLSDRLHGRTSKMSLAKFFWPFIWARLRSVVCPCERVGAGVGFFRQVGGFERSGSLGPGLGPVLSGSSRVSGSGFAMSGLPVRRGRTVARSSGALLSAATARSFGPGGKINARTLLFLRTG